MGGARHPRVERVPYRHKFDWWRVDLRCPNGILMLASRTRTRHASTPPGGLLLTDETTDLIFAASGGPVSVDHGYTLYGALSRELAWLHDVGEPVIGVFPLTGSPEGGGRLALNARSRLRLRLPVRRVADAVGLTAATLDVAGARVTLGPPSIRRLTPSASLWSPLVLIKVAGRSGEDAVEPASFLAAVDRQLAALSVDGEASLPLHIEGERAGEPRRKVLRVKGATHAGYPVLVSGLSADDSLALQRSGLGGRRRMGCGLFLPWRGK